MRLSWQDLLTFFIFLGITIATPENKKLILLGAALIFLSPFIVLERYYIPFLRKNPKISVLAGLLTAMLGAYLLTLSYSC